MVSDQLFTALFFLLWIVAPILQSAMAVVLRRKKLDMIAANQVGGGMGFETADNALTLYWADGSQELPRASKTELARELVTCVAERFEQARA